MDKQKKLWLIIAIVVVALIIVIALTGKKAPQPTAEESLIPEEVSVEELPAAPEVEVKGPEPVAVAPGASGVTEEGIVVTEEGSPAVTDSVGPNDPNAPKQSMVFHEDVPEEKQAIEGVAESAITMTVDEENWFLPREFRVKPGQAVTILLSNQGQEHHDLRFFDMSLHGVAISVLAGETRAVTFNAPVVPGEYKFACMYYTDQAQGTMFVVEE